MSVPGEGIATKKQLKRITGNGAVNERQNQLFGHPAPASLVPDSVRARERLLPQSAGGVG